MKLKIECDVYKISPKIKNP